MKWLLPILFAVQVHGAAIIITNASLPLPTGAAFSAVLNNRPGSNAVASCNPPRFSWFYSPTFTNIAELGAGILRYRTFQLQCSTNADFSTLDVDVSTDVNFYNFLAPFQNSPVYWRVKYYTNVLGAASLQEAIGRTNLFTFTATTTNWDRSMFADTNYLATNAVHPFIMLRTGNRLAMSNAVATNIFVRWDLAQYYTFNTLTNIFWPGRPTNYVDGHLSDAEWCRRMGHIALHWQLTRDPSIQASNPGVALACLATNFMASVPTNGGIVSNTTYKVYGNAGCIVHYNGAAYTNHQTFLATGVTNWIMSNGYANVCAPAGVARIEGDVVTTSSYFFPALALGYDWLYDLLTAQQKTQIVAALDARCDWIVNGSAAFQLDSSYDGTSYGLGAQSHNIGGFSHDIENWNTTMIMAMAGHVDGGPMGFTNCYKLFRVGLNYMTGVTYCYGFEGGMNQGRGYSAVVQFVASSFTKSHLQFTASLPRANLGANPWWQTNAVWWDYMFPVSFKQGHGPWGDEGFGTISPAFWDWKTSRELAWLTQSKRTWDHWTNEIPVYYPGLGYVNIEAIEDYDRLPLFYHFNAPPTTPYITNTAAIFPEDGWAMASTYAPHESRAFTNGAGIIFCARPRASEIGHSGQTDLSFQLWAYGACLTDSGAEGLIAYAHVPQSAYTILVNGYGPSQPYLVPIVDGDYYARFTAWTNSDTFSYFAATGTKGYPRIPFSVSGAQLPGGYVNTHGSAPLRDLTNITRHVVFPRKKYWVFFDDCGATTNFTYSQLWHILESTNSVNTNTLSLSYASTNNWGTGGAVTTYVAFGSATNLTSMIKLTGATTLVETNLFLSGDFGQQDSRPRHTTLWVQNKNKSTNWQSGFVVYPVQPGVAGAPTIVWRDTFTVCVTNSSGTEGDVISFGAASDAPADATHVVALNQTSGGGGGVSPSAITLRSGGSIRSGGNTRQ